MFDEKLSVAISYFAECARLPISHRLPRAGGPHSSRGSCWRKPACDNPACRAVSWLNDHVDVENALS